MSSSVAPSQDDNVLLQITVNRLLLLLILPNLLHILPGGECDPLVNHCTDGYGGGRKKVSCNRVFNVL